MKRKLESDLQDEVKQFLINKRVYHWRFQAQSNLNGVPDILCLYKGFFIGLELKRPKQGTPTELQLRTLKAINDNGGIGIIVDQLIDVERLIDVIDDYYYCDNIYAENILEYYEIRTNKYEKK